MAIQKERATGSFSGGKRIFHSHSAKPASSCLASSVCSSRLESGLLSMSTVIEPMSSFADDVIMPNKKRKKEN